MPAQIYAYTRTPADFALDSLAWVESWMTPARLFLRGGDGDDSATPGEPMRPGRGSGRAPISNRIPDRYSWLRPSGAQRVRFVDIDAMDTPARVDGLRGILAQSLPVTNAATVQDWERKVRARARRVVAPRPSR